MKDRERNVWSFSRLEPWPEFDVVYTGKLTVSYGGWTQGLRGSWADGKTQTIESLLREIIAGLRLIIAAKAEDDRHRKANELRRQALREQAERRRRLEEREAKRIDFLNRLERDRKELTDWQSAVAVLPRTDNPPGEYASTPSGSSHFDNPPSWRLMDRNAPAPNWSGSMNLKAPM
ncbi:MULTISPECIES: hypothetical protein [Agrobacterium tumefaciens complex]|uniref:hypothetical protein n=1 Tax=Agrobacterium tumefaciens complex TaxID=1183400 RepID=UPI000DD4E789|nr:MULTISPECIES: hypothetical protein [Agrobacterium tumefaciens complex]MBB4406865.1 hypothetical protein [Agrobacterium radiobacter]MBB4452931.1 hypothetical protein [Agrobacterium radiobacter]MDP9875477.1 hypothetical protein [Agrobacterium tumefaciens]MDP9980413.1 hypothetical protein [Agrobacterium tumefaciens]